MLAGNQPDLLFLRQRRGAVRIRHRQERHVAPVQRAAESLERDMLAGTGGADQVEVALMGIGLEIGQVNALGLGCEGHRHDLPVKACVEAKPVLAVVAGHHAVVLPTLGEGALARIEEAQAHRHRGGAVQRKVEPLSKFAGVVAPDVELDVAGVGQADHVDGARVELGRDVECGRHGGPGKSGHCKSVPVSSASSGLSMGYCARFS